MTVHVFCVIFAVVLAHEAIICCCVACATKQCPFCLKAIQCCGLASIASIILVSLLPRFMTVFAERIAVTVPVIAQATCGYAQVRDGRASLPAAMEFPASEFDDLLSLHLLNKF
jgi:hypothetical protein